MSPILRAFNGSASAVEYSEKSIARFAFEPEHELVGPIYVELVAQTDVTFYHSTKGKVQPVRGTCCPAGIPVDRF